jgi:hypothetical protein
MGEGEDDGEITKGERMDCALKRDGRNTEGNERTN